ncbi:DUF814-domain-containing protein [Jaminaea rosea]|uniref:DUF814-domain-containing protein n=1 Tax=Jaminaea rosea TaxID=1569628 RepID=A0A316UWL7_9BASI|nr:DUF814-domain-containing protein [Jaminaea rosea]PWN29700.1 DUF814-domain-containing protein [Jaminaea rosea]
MVLFFESRALDPPVTIYMGIDKFENEDLLKYAFEEDVWFHVDKLSSAHVYLRMPQGMTWEAIPAALLEDLGQLTKANSIQGNKEKNTQIIYTPAANVMKRGDFATGTVSFHSQHKVKRYLVKERENAIVNRLNKTKKTVQVDHEAVRQDRERQKGREKKAKATEERNARLAEERQRDADRKARDYSSCKWPRLLASYRNVHSAHSSLAPSLLTQCIRARQLRRARQPSGTRRIVQREPRRKLRRPEIRRQMMRKTRVMRVTIAQDHSCSD